MKQALQLYRIIIEKERSFLSITGWKNGLYKVKKTSATIYSIELFIRNSYQKTCFCF